LYNEDEVLPHVVKPYVIGKTISETKIMSMDHQLDEFTLMTVDCVEFLTYFTESKPTGKLNYAFPRSIA